MCKSFSGILSKWEQDGVWGSKIQKAVRNFLTAFQLVSGDSRIFDKSKRGTNSATSKQFNSQHFIAGIRMNFHKAHELTASTLHSRSNSTYNQKERAFQRGMEKVQSLDRENDLQTPLTVNKSTNRWKTRDDTSRYSESSLLQRGSRYTFMVHIEKLVRFFT